MNIIIRQETNFLVVLWIALTCIFSGALIGGTTNAINGFVSPTYFEVILGWDFPSIWEASIVQGIFEGLINGFLFSVVFGTSFALVTKGRAPYSFGLKYLLRVIGIVYCCWALGGLLAMGLATFSPDFYRATFKGVPNQFKDMMGYAWVGGSIWGAMLGGVLGLLIGVLNLRSAWKGKFV